MKTTSSKLHLKLSFASILFKRKIVFLEISEDAGNAIYEYKYQVSLFFSIVFRG